MESLLTTACLLYFKQAMDTEPSFQHLAHVCQGLAAQSKYPKATACASPGSTPCTERLCERHCWALTLTVNVHICKKQLKYFQSVLKVNLNGREQKKIVNQIKHSIMSLELLDAPKAILRYCSLRTHFKLNSQIPNGQRSSTQETSSQTQMYQRGAWKTNTLVIYLAWVNLGKGHSIPMLKFLYKHRKRCHKSALFQPASRIIRFILVQCTFQHGLRKENGTWGNDKFHDHSKTVS